MSYTCSCDRYCHGEETVVSRTTWYSHAQYRKAAIPPVPEDLVALHHGRQLQSSSSQPGPLRASPHGIPESRSEPEVPEEPLRKRRRTEHDLGTSPLEQDGQDGRDDMAGRSGEGGLPEDHVERDPNLQEPVETPASGSTPPQHPSHHPPLDTEYQIPPDFVPSIGELKIALDFLRALQSASLDNGDLDEDELHLLRNPPTEPVVIDDKDIILSMKLFLSTSNASDQTYINVRNNFIEDDPTRRVLSHHSVKKKLAELTGVFPIVKDMCPNSCMGYTGPWSDLEECPICRQPRRERSKARQHFYTLPLGPQLQALWRAPETAKNMHHRRRTTTEILASLREGGSIPVFEDIYHGEDYLTAVENGHIKIDDMVLLFSIDGAQLYQDKQSDCWIYIWVIYDLPPELRYKKRHVLPGGFIPGPNNPKNTDSFLFPGFHHIAALQKEGLTIWDAYRDIKFISNPFVYLGGADGPGSVHFTGLVGHQGAYPCRRYCGIKGRHKPNAPQHYPALLKPAGYAVDGCSHGDIDPTEIGQDGGQSVDLYQINLKHILGSRNPTDYKNRRRDTGISTLSIFSGLPLSGRLPLPAGFPGDIMHVSTLNLGEVFVPLWRGTFTCAPTDNINNWAWVIFKNEDDWAAHGQIVAATRPFIPNSYDRPPRNIADKIHSGYKAKEWQGYYYGLTPALLCNRLPRAFWQNFCKLTRGIRLLHQRSIPSSQLARAHQLICEFHHEFELLYCQRRTDRLHFVRPCLHALLHIAPETVRLGPVPLHSCWTIERVIGDLGGEVRQPQNPYQNLSERGLRRCQINALKASFEIFHEATPGLPKYAMDIGGGYAFLVGKDRAPKYLQNEVQALVVKNFFISNEEEFGNAPQVDWAGPLVTRWARLRLPNGQTARSVWKESRMRSPDVRRASCVKIQNCNGAVWFANVQFYFKGIVNNQEKFLALVMVFSDPDRQMLEDSYETVHSINTPSDSDPSSFRVINAKTIQSVVAVIPHDYKTEGSTEQRYFVWEQIGMDMAQLCDIFQDDGEDSDDEDIY